MKGIIPADDDLISSIIAISHALAKLSVDRKSMFYNKMHPSELIKQAEEKYGNEANWDRHIRFRHNQYTRKTKSRVPKYLESYGRVTQWNKEQELSEEMMRYRDRELPNPKGIKRSEIMVELMENALNNSENSLIPKNCP